MMFSEALQIEKGVTAVVGSGGKSTLLAVLAWELRQKGTVLLCTTTKMYPPEQTFTLYDVGEEELREAIPAFGIVCAGALAENGKIAAPKIPMSKLQELADFVLVEADGAKGLPLKAHMEHEPVIPPEAGQTICVVGASGLGQPIHKAVHRAARFAELAGAAAEARATPALVAKVLHAEALADRVFVNQADGPAEQALARELQELLHVPAVIGSLQNGTVLCES